MEASSAHAMLSMVSTVAVGLEGRLVVDVVSVTELAARSQGGVAVMLLLVAQEAVSNGIEEGVGSLSGSCCMPLEGAHVDANTWSRVCC